MLEKKDLCQVVGLFKVGEVGFFSGEPDGEFAIVCIDAFDSSKIGLYLVGNLVVLFRHTERSVVGQLDQQQRINVYAEFLIGLCQAVALFQGTTDEVLVQLTVIVIALRNVRIQDDLLLDHLFFYYCFARNVDDVITWGLRRGGNSDFHLGIDALQHFLGLVGGLRPKQVFLIDDDNDGDAFFVLGAASDFVKRQVLFAFTNYDVLFLVDAFPVDEKNLTRMDVAIGLVDFVVEHGAKLAGFCKTVFQLEIALFVQLIGRNPDVGHLLVGAIATRLQFLGERCQELRSHDGFA